MVCLPNLATERQPRSAVNPHKELCFRDCSFSLLLIPGTEDSAVSGETKMGSVYTGLFNSTLAKIADDEIGQGRREDETINKLGLKVARVGAPLSPLQASYWSYRAPTSLLWARQRDWLVAGRWSSQAAYE